MVAFSWNGADQGNFDIYVKVADSPNALRLTTDPAPDTAPAWSPDGRQIAFLRNPGPGGAVYVISALGGAERRINSFNPGESVGWMLDSRRLLVSDRGSPGDPYAGFVVSETGEPEQITFHRPAASREITTSWLLRTAGRLRFAVWYAKADVAGRVGFGEVCRALPMGRARHHGCNRGSFGTLDHESDRAEVGSDGTAVHPGRQPVQGE
jgi:hypothetical protein